MYHMYLPGIIYEIRYGTVSAELGMYRIEKGEELLISPCPLMEKEFQGFRTLNSFDVV